MEKKNKKPETNNPPPTMDEFENLLRNVMFKKPPTLKQIREMNKVKRETKKKK